MKRILGLSLVLVCAPLAQAADIEAGKANVATVCAACHGADGVSVSDTIPNLAAQRAGYIEAQLKVLKDGTRKNPHHASHRRPTQRRGHRQRGRLFRLAARRGGWRQIRVAAQCREDQSDVS